MFQMSRDGGGRDENTGNKSQGKGIKAEKHFGIIQGSIDSQNPEAEGNFDCFGTAKGYCDQLQCCFRQDCLSPSGTGRK